MPTIPVLKRILAMLNEELLIGIERAFCWGRASRLVILIRSGV